MTWRRGTHQVRWWNHAQERQCVHDGLHCDRSRCWNIGCIKFILEISVQRKNTPLNCCAGDSRRRFWRLFYHNSRRERRTTYLHNFPQLCEWVLRVNGVEVGNPSYEDALHYQPWSCCFPCNVEASQWSPQVLLQHNGTCRRDLVSVWVGLAWVEVCLYYLRFHPDAPHCVKVCCPQGRQHIPTYALYILRRS